MLAGLEFEAARESVRKIIGSQSEYRSNHNRSRAVRQDGGVSGRLRRVTGAISRPWPQRNGPDAGFPPDPRRRATD